MILRIPLAAFDRIRMHGEQTYPEECCGVMLGVQTDEERTVRMILPMDNVQTENRGRRFLLSPEQYLEAERQSAELQMDILGFYHSHPDHPALPSSFDTEHAYPWFAYVIASVSGGKAGEVTAWLLAETRGRFDKLPLLVGDSEDAPVAARHTKA
ncbi:MAG: M67 family metallopeptidase [Bacteroidota bacterium]